MACASPDCKSGPYVVNNVGSTPTSPTILPRQKVLGLIMTLVVRYHNDFFGTSTAMLRGGMVRDKLAD